MEQIENLLYSIVWLLLAVLGVVAVLSLLKHVVWRRIVRPKMLCKKVHNAIKPEVEHAVARFPGAVGKHGLNLGDEKKNLLFQDVTRYKKPKILQVVPYAQHLGVLLVIRETDAFKKYLNVQHNVDEIAGKLFPDNESIEVSVVRKHSAVSGRKKIGLACTFRKTPEYRHAVPGASFKLRAGVDLSSGNDYVLDVRDGHAVVAGRTASGKSTFMQNVLGNLALLQQRTQAVEIAGIDLHGGLLMPFEHDGALVWTGNSGTSPETGVDVLEELVKKMEHRLRFLHEKRIQRIDPNNFNSVLPMVFVCIDELQGFYTTLARVDAEQGNKGAGRLENRARNALSRLYAESHKVGFRVWSSSQKPTIETFGGAVRENAVKVFLFANERHINKIVMQVSDEDANMLESATMPGLCLVRDELLGSVPCQMDYLAYDDYLSIVEQGIL